MTSILLYFRYFLLISFIHSQRCLFSAKWPHLDFFHVKLKSRAQGLHKLEFLIYFLKPLIGRTPDITGFSIKIGPLKYDYNRQAIFQVIPSSSSKSLIPCIYNMFKFQVIPFFQNLTSLAFINVNIITTGFSLK